MLSDLISSIRSPSTPSSQTLSNITSSFMSTGFASLIGRVGDDDPHYTTISPGPIRPLRRGDSESNILAKMYIFMRKEREERIKKYELEKDFEKERLEEEERRHEKLVEAIKKSTGRGKVEDVKKNPLLQMLKKLLSFTKTVIGTLFSFGKMFSNVLSIIPDMIFPMIKSVIGKLIPSIMGRLTGTLFSILKPLFSVIGVSATAIAGLTGTAAQMYAGFQQEDASEKNIESLKEGAGRPTGIDNEKYYKIKHPVNFENVDVSLTDEERERLQRNYKELKNIDDNVWNVLGTPQQSEMRNKRNQLLEENYSILQGSIKREENRTALTREQRSLLEPYRRVDPIGNFFEDISKSIGESIDDSINGLVSSGDFSDRLLQGLNEGQSQNVRKFMGGSTDASLLEEDEDEHEEMQEQKLSEPSAGRSIPALMSENQSGSSEPIVMNNSTSSVVGGTTSVLDNRPINPRNDHPSFRRAQSSSVVGH